MKTPKTGKKTLRLIVFAVLLPAVLATVAIITFPKEAASEKLPDEIRDLLVDNPPTIKPFELLDHEKKPFNVDRFKGAWTLIFFGYTHCPDVCPTTLTEVDNAAGRLKNYNTGPNKIQYVFVSIDPKRDTHNLLSDYISYFGVKFIAATGEHEQLKLLTKQLNIRYKIGIGFNKEYIVNHSSSILLIDPQGRYYARFKAPHYSEEIVASFKKLNQYYGVTSK